MNRFVYRIAFYCLSIAAAAALVGIDTASWKWFRDVGPRETSITERVSDVAFNWDAANSDQKWQHHQETKVH